MIEGLSVTLTHYLIVGAVIFGFGTVIALGPILGLWGAMAAVSLSVLALAAMCALVALVRVKRMKAVLGEGNGDGAGS